MKEITPSEGKWGMLVNNIVILPFSFIGLGIGVTDGNLNNSVDKMENNYSLKR